MYMDMILNPLINDQQSTILNDLRSKEKYKYKSGMGRANGENVQETK